MLGRRGLNRWCQCLLQDVSPYLGEPLCGDAVYRCVGFRNGYDRRNFSPLCIRCIENRVTVLLSNFDLERRRVEAQSGNLEDALRRRDDAAQVLLHGLDSGHDGGNDVGGGRRRSCKVEESLAVIENGCGVKSAHSLDRDAVWRFGLRRDWDRKWHLSGADPKAAGERTSQNRQKHDGAASADYNRELRQGRNL